MQEEVKVWFGSENDIHAWHHLCRAVGVQDPPATREQCEQACLSTYPCKRRERAGTNTDQRLRNTHVNIVDLIEWGRTGQTDTSVEVFGTEEALVDYTKRKGKYFPQDGVENDAGEKNVVLRHLLRKMRHR